MERDGRANRYSPETRERAVRMVLENQGSDEDRSAAIRAMAPKIGCRRETPSPLGGAVGDRYREPGWCEQPGAGPDQGAGTRGPGTAAGERDPEEGQRVFCPRSRTCRAGAAVQRDGARPPVQAMIAFIDEFGMRPPSVRGPCRTRPAWGQAIVAPSVRATMAARSAGFCRSPHPRITRTSRRPAILRERAVVPRRDAELMPEVRRVWEENLQVYGVCKVWRQLRREGFDVAVRRLSRTDGVHLLTTVARLMKKMGIQGVIRGKSRKTTIPDPALPCPRDKVNRQFRAPAPNRLWGRPSWRHRSEPDGRRLHICLDLAGRPAWPSDQWRPHAELYVAFVIDTFADRIVGWRASRSRQTQFVLPSRDHGSRTTLSGGGGPRTGPARAPSGRGSDPPFGSRRAISIAALRRTTGPRRASNHRSLRGLSRPHRGHGPPSPSATATIMPWPRPSSGRSRPRSSTVSGP